MKLVLLILGLAILAVLVAVKNSDYPVRLKHDRSSIGKQRYFSTWIVCSGADICRFSSGLRSSPFLSSGVRDFYHCGL
jgi:hypothetical protein